jgi:diacylglycerol kinase family enzyme
VRKRSWICANETEKEGEIMDTYYILYNPMAGNGTCQKHAECLQAIYDYTKLIDMTGVDDYRTFVDSLDPDDTLVIVGGDGTLNRFVNDTDGIDISQEILYLPAGTGNDFAKDLGKDGCGNPFAISRYLKYLPSVEVKGKHYRFVNGIGFGIDGYCCQVGDELKKAPGNKVNYTAIAIKGLLFLLTPGTQK